MQQFTPIWEALLTWSAYTVHALLVALAAVFGIWSVPLLPSVATGAGLALVFLGLFLYGAAAVEPIEPLDFETDARILRGVWTGEDERGHKLLTDANASAPDDSG